MPTLEVEFENSPIRLDVFIVGRLGGLSRSFIQSLCTDGKVSVNGTVITKTGTKLKAHDRVVVEYDETKQEPLSIELPIIYEDDDCVVIDKPAGVLTHSKGAFNPEGTVATWLTEHLGKKADFTDNSRAGIVHRLDRITSGVMICAKTEEAQVALQKQFADRHTKKTYLAIIDGELEPAEAIIDMPIERNPKQPQTFRAGHNGKSAQTAYKVIETSHGHSLVELKPVTGRTHQLRVHLSHQGHPIVGDLLYGGIAAPRVFLHAHKLSITLPSGTLKTFDSPMPEEFRDLMSNETAA